MKITSRSIKCKETNLRGRKLNALTRHPSG